MNVISTNELRRGHSGVRAQCRQAAPAADAYCVTLESMQNGNIDLFVPSHYGRSAARQQWHRVTDCHHSHYHHNLSVLTDSPTGK